MNRWSSLPLRIRLLVMATTVCAIGGIWYWGDAPEANARAAKRIADAVPVDITTAELASVPVYLDALGTVQAFNTATVTTRIDGQLEKIGFTEGNDVKAGDVLAQIDPRPYEAQLAQAEAKQTQDAAQLANAQRDVERYAMLTPDNYASKQTLDAARSQATQLDAQVKADRAAIAAVKTQLSYTTITAPFSGRTGLRLVDAGNIVRSSDPSGLVVITQLQPIAVLFTVPQDELPRVSAAMANGSVSATAFARDGKTELGRGTVTLIDNRIDPGTGTVRLKAQFPNSDNRLWPGQFVSIRMLVETLNNALTVPSTAVSQGPHGSFVYVVKEDRTVELRSIATGPDAGSHIVVDHGLANGEQVVTAGQYRLQPGARVQASGRGEQIDPPGHVPTGAGQ